MKYYVLYFCVLLFLFTVNFAAEKAEAVSDDEQESQHMPLEDPPSIRSIANIPIDYSLLVLFFENEKRAKAIWDFILPQSKRATDRVKRAIEKEEYVLFRYPRSKTIAIGIGCTEQQMRNYLNLPKQTDREKENRRSGIPKE